MSPPSAPRFHSVAHAPAASAKRPARRWIGRWLCVVGVLHTTLGVLVFHDLLGAMLREGV